MAGAFLKKGSEAQQAMEHEEQKAEAAKAAANKPLRFWMPKDTDKKITFLDGDLDENGLLAIPMLYEHQVYMNGNWRNWFACVGEDEPCPICEGGDKPALVGLMTIIDHSEHTDRNGNTHKDEVRMFTPKRTSIKQLQKLATKRDGLAGCTFDVSRTGEQSPGVGNMFDFDGKEDPAKIMEQYGVSVVDYEEQITYMPAQDLRNLGFGSSAPLGSESAPNGGGGSGGGGEQGSSIEEEL